MDKNNSIPKNILEDIEDVMVHFDDEKYKWSVETKYSFDGSASLSMLNDMRECLYRKDTDSPSEIEYFVIISIYKPLVMSFTRWSTYVGNLKTAILRINRKGNDVMVESDGEYGDRIVIKMDSHEIRNVRKLSELCKNFNRKMSSQLVMSPQYHPEKGVEIYILEQKSVNPRGFYFDKVIEYSPSLLEEFVDVEKKFESNEQAFGENPYLSGGILTSQNIISRVSPKHFQIR